jgi:predicted ATPase
MPRVIVTGGPGVGKTTMLHELAALGHAVIAESAREIIRERLEAGLSPRPAPRAFAAELLRRDQAKHASSVSGVAPVFFDRCLVESVAMARESGLLSQTEGEAMLRDARFHRRVFLLPPWREIYVQDAQRDHSFEHCERVHDALARWYAACGYEVHEVPSMSPRARAEHVLRALGAGGSSMRVASEH